MHYGNIKPIDSANGPGVRVSLFVSGCTNHCKGCFSPQTWNFDFGEPYTDDTTLKLLELVDKPYISGLSILGGDPMHPFNRKTVLDLLIKFRSKFGKSKTVWMWTGYLYEDLKNENSEEVDEIFSLVDVLVDGPFIEELKDPTLRFRGSSNQRIIDLKQTLEGGKVVGF